MTDELRIKAMLIEAINKDGEGRDYFRDTGKRLWEARPNTFIRSGYATKKFPNVYLMQANDQQIVAYYVDGKVSVTHHGHERRQLDDYIKNAIKKSRIKVGCHMRNSNKIRLPSINEMKQGFKF